MSEPVTLVTLFDDLGEVGWHEVGQFVERAWCATHDSRMHDSNHCDYAFGLWPRDLCVPEPLPRLVQEPPNNANTN